MLTIPQAADGAFDGEGHNPVVDGGAASVVQRHVRTVATAPVVVDCNYCAYAAASATARTA